MDKKYFLYKITNNFNSKVYIGCTSLSIKKRFDRHKTKVKRGSQFKIHKTIRKHGLENFTIRRIKTCKTKEEGLKFEKIFIRKYNSFKNGYNMNLGGEGLYGLKLSEGTKKKIGQRMIGNKYWLGKKHSEKTKKKMSLAKKGNKNALGYKHILGHKLTEEHKKKIGLALKGREFSEETKKMMSEARRRYWEKKAS